MNRNDVEYYLHNTDEGIELLQDIQSKAVNDFLYNLDVILQKKSKTLQIKTGLKGRVLNEETGKWEINGKEVENVGRCKNYYRDKKEILK